MPGSIRRDLINWILDTYPHAATTRDGRPPTFTDHPNGRALRMMTEHYDRVIRARARYLSADDVENLADVLRARVALAAAIAGEIHPSRLARVRDESGIGILYREIKQVAAEQELVLWEALRDAVFELDARATGPTDPAAVPSAAGHDSAQPELVLSSLDPTHAEMLVRFGAEFLALLEAGTDLRQVTHSYSRAINTTVPGETERRLHALARRVHQRIAAVNGGWFSDYLNGLQLPPVWRPGDLAQLRDGHPEHTVDVRVLTVRPGSGWAVVNPLHTKSCNGDHPGADEACGPNEPPMAEAGQHFEVPISDLNVPPVGYRPDLSDANPDSSHPSGDTEQPPAGSKITSETIVGERVVDGRRVLIQRTTWSGTRKLSFDVLDAETYEVLTEAESFDDEPTDEQVAAVIQAGAGETDAPPHQ